MHTIDSMFIDSFKSYFLFGSVLFNIHVILLGLDFFSAFSCIFWLSVGSVVCLQVTVLKTFWSVASMYMWNNPGTFLRTPSYTC